MDSFKKTLNYVKAMETLKALGNKLHTREDRELRSLRISLPDALMTKITSTSSRKGIALPKLLNRYLKLGHKIDRDDYGVVKREVIIRDTLVGGVVKDRNINLDTFKEENEK